jgi:hypothetical protein
VTRNKHTKAGVGTSRVLTSLALGAGIVLAACGTTQAMSGTNATNDTGRTSLVRDPDNASWTGIHPSDGLVSGSARTSVIRDADNPYWTGADATRALVSDPAADPRLRGPR